METIATLTPGQHIIFGMILSHFSNRLNLIFPAQNYGRLASLIIELDEPKANEYDLTTSESMEEYPEGIQEIFESFWENFEEVFLALQQD